MAKSTPVQPHIQTSVFPNPNPLKDEPPNTGLDPQADFTTDECAVVLLTDGSGEITFLVDPEVLRRVRSRCGDRNLAAYFWEFLLKRAVMDHVY